MADRRNPVTLTSPGGATVKCAANKDAALAVATRPVNGHPALSVIFRTNDLEALARRGRREARQRSRPVLVFNLLTGAFVGSYTPNGESVHNDRMVRIENVR